jgi:outer membrane lipoprotein-sorting protein
LDSALKTITNTFLFLTIPAAVCLCQQESLIDRIKQNYSGATAFSATVDIRIVWKVREKTDNMHGSIVLAPDDRFRVDLGTTLWVSDGATLWQYDKALSQVIITALSNNGNAMIPSRIVADYCSKYPLKASKNKAGYDVLEWKADSASGVKATGVSYVRITALGARAAVRELFIIDSNGNETTYAFGKTVWNGAVPKNSFAFEAPKGARVIDKR